MHTSTDPIKTLMASIESHCLKGFVSGAPGKWAKAMAEATTQQAQPMNTERPVKMKTALSQMNQCHGILQG